MPEMQNPLAIQMADDIAKAFKQFGQHAYYDKGPHEVMDVDKWVAACRAAGVDDALAALKELAGDVDGCVLVVELLGEMQDWDELFEADTEFTDKLYN